MLFRSNGIVKIQDSLPREFYLLAWLQACYMTVFRVQCLLTLHDTLLGAFKMSPEEQEIERLERQINSLRRKQIFDRVEVPKAKYGIPRNEETASKANTKGTEEEISNGPITKATVRPVDKEPVVDNPKKRTPEHPLSNIPEAHYVAPNTKNFGAPAEKIPKDKETAYRMVVPAVEKQLVDDVF